jgi:hypothetical protein
MHPLQPWLDLAFDVVDAPLASQAIAHHRDQRTAQGLTARSYELVVPEPCPPLAAYLNAVCPRLSDHLVALGQSPRGAAGVFLSVFVGPRLHFLGSLETLALHQSLTPPLALPGRTV